ncbi:hypothetical protein F4819DRAFT_489679 [Hypoxylon fuscum]|nr:hypothetical protein F4819DRAFT_489679 [Hypoxylon fuscum]
MQFFAVLAFITAALAKPVAPREEVGFECEPPAYACKPDFTGWLVCNVDGFYLDAGDCAPEAWCEYIDGLPYCIS